MRVNSIQYITQVKNKDKILNIMSKFEQLKREVKVQ